MRGGALNLSTASLAMQGTAAATPRSTAAVRTQQNQLLGQDHASKNRDTDETAVYANATTEPEYGVLTCLPPYGSSRGNERAR